MSKFEKDQCQMSTFGLLGPYSYISVFLHTISNNDYIPLYAVTNNNHWWVIQLVAAWWQMSVTSNNKECMSPDVNTGVIHLLHRYNRCYWPLQEKKAVKQFQEEYCYIVAAMCQRLWPFRLGLLFNDDLKYYILLASTTTSVRSGQRWVAMHVYALSSMHAWHNITGRA